MYNITGFCQFMDKLYMLAPYILVLVKQVCCNYSSDSIKFYYVIMAQ